MLRDVLDVKCASHTHRRTMYVKSSAGVLCFATHMLSRRATAAVALLSSGVVSRTGLRNAAIPLPGYMSLASIGGLCYHQVAIFTVEQVIKTGLWIVPPVRRRLGHWTCKEHRSLIFATFLQEETDRLRYTYHTNPLLPKCCVKFTRLGRSPRCELITASLRLPINPCTARNAVCSEAQHWALQQRHQYLLSTQMKLRKESGRSCPTCWRKKKT